MQKQKKPRGKRMLLTALAVLVFLGCVSLTYLLSYYHAEPAALALWDSTEGTVLEDGRIILLPEEPNGIGLIFYPGASVEAAAYLPLLDGIRAQGITCFQVEMPFRQAFFNPDAAEKIISEHPEIQTWYLGGHSLGGAMASDYASKHPQQIAGLILVAAYPYGDYPLTQTLTVYGSLNTSVAERIDYTENVTVIPGGNHAQFGAYGHQLFDVEAEITPEEQRAQAIEAITAFVNRMQEKNAA